MASVSKSKILFIGGTGYIGKFIVEASAKAGDLNDHGSLVDAMKKVDVVISTVGHGMLTQQVKIIAAIKEAGNVKVPLPVSCNCFAGYFLSNLAQPSGNVPPRDKVIILGDGNAKDDPRTLNKLVYIRPPNNIYSFNDLVSLWERKIEKKLERVYVPEEEILKHTRVCGLAGDVMLALNHSILVKGCQTSFEIEDSFGVEASEIYPDVKYTTVDEYLDQFV
ncbi:Phenylcoumaran benzylic ether reductase 1 [Linum perenne]